MRWNILTVTLPAAALFSLAGAAYGQISAPTSNFGSSGSSVGNSITPSASSFSNAVQASSGTLTSGSTGMSGTGGTGGTGGTSGGSGAQGTSDGAVNSAAMQMQQNNAINPFAASSTGQGGSGNRNSAMSQFSRGMSAMFGNNAFGQNFGNSTEQKQIPTKMVIKFSHPTIKSTTVGRSLRRNLPWPNVAVAMDGPVATLTGTVDSEDLRTVAERFVKMEPGVTEVKNELQVAPQPLPQ